ncbi:type IV pilus assembly PilZ [Sphingomonas sp. MM-1]|nr:type IV pilus assembly PilZ [Sphingomonas sp. MM-1]
MSLAAKLRQTFDEDEERRSTRTRLLLDGGVRHGTEDFADITVHDLSVDGFRAESAMELSPGMTVEIDLPGIGVREADVMWAGYPYAGCAFVQPLLREQVRAALAESPVVWGEFGGSEDMTSAVSRGAAIQIAAAVAEAVTPPATADETERPLPFGTRLRSILLINGLLWAGIVAVAWMLFG